MPTPKEISNAIANAFSLGQSVAVVSLVPGAEAPPASKLVVADQGRPVIGSLDLGNEFDSRVCARAAEVIAAEKDDIAAIEVDGRRLVVEVARPPQELIVCGAGHVGQAVAVAGTFLGFRVMVIDDREEFANRKYFPDESVKLIAGDFVESLRGLRITRASHLVIVTRGHRHDEICLKEVIDSPARYLGMIGSRRRTTTIRAHLKNEGVAEHLLDRLRAPIGLDIGALTPEEIAISIMAEIIMARRGGNGDEKKRIFATPELTGPGSIFQII